jgi:hypothetical protein
MCTIEETNKFFEEIKAVEKPIKYRKKRMCNKTIFENRHKVNYNNSLTLSENKLYDRLDKYVKFGYCFYVGDIHIKNLDIILNEYRLKVKNDFTIKQ